MVGFVVPSVGIKRGQGSKTIRFSKGFRFIVLSVDMSTLWMCKDTTLYRQSQTLRRRAGDLQGILANRRLFITFQVSFD